MVIPYPKIDTQEEKPISGEKRHSALKMFSAPVGSSVCSGT